LNPKSVRDDERLRQREERNARLLAFMNHSPSLMFIKDLEGRYLYVNDRFEQAFGLESKDIISRTDFEIFSAELATQFRANDAKVLATGVGIEVEALHGP
jgi:PAS domain S-box-containing protein